MLGYSFKLNPSLQDLEDIANWMRSDSKAVNLNSISEAWARQELILIIQNKSILGLCVFETKPNVGVIHILEVKKNQRNQKFGTYLTEYILRIMASKNIERVEICVPNSNVKPFWEKFGFQEIFNDYDDSNLYMYINLINK
jgi:ribosomal protein S18 acetylase RimI-like enzyme